MRFLSVLTALSLFGLGACNVTYTDTTSSLPTFTVSGPPDTVSEFVDLQMARHPDLYLSRKRIEPDHLRVTLSVPQSVSSDELAEMGREAIAAHLSVEMKS